MPLISTAELVRMARADGRGVGAFNVITLEHAEAIVAGAEAAGAPVVCQISENAVRFHGGSLGPLASATAAVAEAARVPVGLHLDHVTDEELLRRACDFGFGSAMYDASALPHEENVAATRAAADWAHDQGLWLEAELGAIGGKDGVHAPGVRTDPEEARAFVAATGVDALAVAVGSSHAMTTRTARLDHELIARLAHAVPAPLVLHGSTGVPDDELRRAARRHDEDQRRYGAEHRLHRSDSRLHHRGHAHRRPAGLPGDRPHPHGRGGGAPAAGPRLMVAAAVSRA